MRDMRQKVAPGDYDKRLGYARRVPKKDPKAENIEAKAMSLLEKRLENVEAALREANNRQRTVHQLPSPCNPTYREVDGAAVGDNVEDSSSVEHLSDGLAYLRKKLKRLKLQSAHFNRLNKCVAPNEKGMYEEALFKIGEEKAKVHKMYAEAIREELSQINGKLYTMSSNGNNVAETSGSGVQSNIVEIYPNPNMSSDKKKFRRRDISLPHIETTNAPTKKRRRSVNVRI